MYFIIVFGVRWLVVEYSTFESLPTRLVIMTENALRGISVSLRKITTVSVGCKYLFQSTCCTADNWVKCCPARHCLVLPKNSGAPKIWVTCLTLFWSLGTMCNFPAFVRGATDHFKVITAWKICMTSSLLWFLTCAADVMYMNHKASFSCTKLDYSVQLRISLEHLS